jgi:hypothetical protein
LLLWLTANQQLPGVRPRGPTHRSSGLPRSCASRFPRFARQPLNSNVGLRPLPWGVECAQSVTVLFLSAAIGHSWRRAGGCLDAPLSRCRRLLSSRQSQEKPLPPGNRRRSSLSCTGRPALSPQHGRRLRYLPGMPKASSCGSVAAMLRATSASSPLPFSGSRLSWPLQRPLPNPAVERTCARSRAGRSLLRWASQS